MNVWMRLLLLVLVCVLVRCSSGVVEQGESLVTGVPPSCSVSRVRHPTTPDEFQQVYQGRTFYADGNHLGLDLRFPEGTAIHPIACGIVRVYRAAQGYGTLAVVIEHRLPQPLTVTNGAGELQTITSFLSIYGHLRTTPERRSGTPLVLRTGDTVGPDDVIGYVQHDAENGDGAEHLHLGIRLQSQAEAERVDTSWFRGYDTSPSQRRYFANPQDFLLALMRSRTPVRSHPVGTVMTVTGNEHWVLDDQHHLRPLSRDGLRRERLESYVVRVDAEEIRCYRVGAPYQSFLVTDEVSVHLFPMLSTVYEINMTRREIRGFVNYDAFRSWGWRDEDIIHDDANPAFVAFSESLSYEGLRRMREGSLVKGLRQSEVAVVSQDRRLPILDWSTFLALGYESTRIVEIDPSVLDEVAFPRGPVLTSEASALCHQPMACLNGRCDAGRVGGGLGTEVDASVSDAGGTPDVGGTRPVETCNGLDDDGDGLPDQIFLCPLNHRGMTCVTACGSNGLRRCVAPRCEWSEYCEPYPESCDNSIDDDCNGLTDCLDPACMLHAACRARPMPELDASMMSMDAVSMSSSIDVPRNMDVGVDRGVSTVPEVSLVDASLPPTDQFVPVDRQVSVDVPEVSGVRYEFRVRDEAGWSATSPYRLRDRWWTPIVCQNTGTINPQPMADGWQRCEINYRLSPFIGSFFSPPHTDWGDRGQLGTVGNAPARCTPTEGTEWRIQELRTGRTLFQGTSADLPCMSVGSQDRHILP